MASGVYPEEVFSGALTGGLLGFLLLLQSPASSGADDEVTATSQERDERAQDLREIHSELLEHVAQAGSIREGLLEMVTSWEFAEFVHTAMNMSPPPASQEGVDIVAHLTSLAHNDLDRVSPAFAAMRRVDDAFRVIQRSQRAKEGQMEFRSLDVGDIEGMFSNACCSVLVPRRAQALAQDTLAFFGGLMVLRDFVGSDSRFTDAQKDEFFEVWVPLAREAAVTVEAGAFFLALRSDDLDEEDRNLIKTQYDASARLRMEDFLDAANTESFLRRKLVAEAEALENEGRMPKVDPPVGTETA